MVLARDILAQKSFDVLTRVQPRFLAFSHLLAIPLKGRFYRHNGRETSSFTIAVLGKCGHGKSSLLNALVGEEIFCASHVGVGTKTAQSVDYELNGLARIRLSILDLPGIGEAVDCNKDHIELYRRAVETASAFIYVIQADQRDLAVDQWVFSELFGRRGRRKRVTIALTQVDKIHPLNRSIPFILSPEQSINLVQKIGTVKKKLKMKTHQIIAVAATEKFGLDNLIDTVAISVD
jgi:uncharacterized protein